MPRCVAHLELDRLTDETELLGQTFGILDPRVQAAETRHKAALRRIRASGHSINYYCPDEDE